MSTRTIPTPTITHLEDDMTETVTETMSTADRIRAALNERAAARPYDPASNPLAHLDLAALTHGVGVDKSADQHPARNLAATQPDSEIAYALESTRLEGLANGRADLSAKRKAAARQRKAKRDQIESIERSAVRPNAEQLTLAWEVVALLHPIIAAVARSKRQHASRYLGAFEGDLTQSAAESIAMVLAKDYGRNDLEILVKAATEMSAESRERGRIPADQLTDDERRERKIIGKSRKWLMTVVNNRVNDTLVNMFRERGNLRWENLDILDTVMAQVSGAGDDPMMSRFKSDKAPSFLGTRFAAPGGIDGNLLATALMAAITEHGLDAIVEVILNEDNRRTDGAVKWADCAELLFRATPGGQGADVWLAVEAATSKLANPRAAQADAARKHVRNLFTWLPSFVVSVVDAFDQYAVGYVVTKERGSVARMRSTFESYLPEDDGVRRPLVPAARFGSAEEAAQAIALHLSVLFTGEQFVNDILSA